jgi:hypothetical protein
VTSGRCLRLLLSSASICGRREHGQRPTGTCGWGSHQPWRSGMCFVHEPAPPARQRWRSSVRRRSASRRANRDPAVSKPHDPTLVWQGSRNEQWTRRCEGDRRIVAVVFAVAWARASTGLSASPTTLPAPDGPGFGQGLLTSAGRGSTSAQTLSRMCCSISSIVNSTRGRCIDGRRSSGVYLVVVAGLIVPVVSASLYRHLAGFVTLSASTGGTEGADM